MYTFLYTLSSLHKTCIIDTENGSADLYADLGEYSVITLERPFTPEKYIKAMEVAHGSGFEVIILDSISHCWENLLSYHAGLTGNSFANWSRVTPRHNAFINCILITPVHMIDALRSKQEYVLIQIDNGKYIPEKMGMKGIQRDGTDYEFTILFELDITHHATSTKDRTGLFMDQPPFIITADTGKHILNWSNTGVSVAQINKMISGSTTLEYLMEINNTYGTLYPELIPLFTSRRKDIQVAMNCQQ